MNPPTMKLVRFLKASLAIAGIVFGQLGFGQSPVVLDEQHPGVRAVMALQADLTPGLMSSAVILGTAVGLDDVTGQPALVVYIDRNNGGAAAAIRSLPPQLRGIAINVEVTEKFRALAGKAGGGTGVNHKSKQSLPIQLGTSGGWAKDLANGYCCGGTLGSLVRDGSGNQYVLSNYHVLEADIVSGGNNTVATLNDPVIQPGLIDVGCIANNAQSVATLVPVHSLPTSNVDCAIAQVVSGAVAADGRILEIGTISASTVTAALNQAVKKSGRTTALTRSKVSGMNATIRVAYDNECAGGSAFTKTFSGQIVLANRGSSFLAGGDSGSLLVEDVTANPRAIGLLYAGSSTSAIANPIGDVLSFLATKLGGPVTMVGQ